MPSITPTDQATFQKLLASDPQIQAIIKSVWGNTPVNQRPSNTPKNLEKANESASKQIAALLKSRGVELPARTFINPRTMSLEGARGWAGLPTAAKVAIIGGLAATGIGAAGAMGAFGGAAGAGAGAGGAGAAAVPSIGVMSGLPAGLGGAGIAGTTGAGLASSAGIAGAAGAGTAGAGAAGSTISGLMGGGAGAGSGAAGAGTAGTAAGAAKGGGLMSSLLKPATLSTIGRGLGAVAETQAGNRGTTLDAMMEADRLKLDQRQDRRAEESDLWRKIQAANYMKSGGKPKTPAVSSSGATLPSFGFGPPPISEEDKQMAATLLPQLQDKLANPMQPRDYDSKMNPGKMESILGWLSPALSGFSAIQEGRNPTPKPPAPGGTITGMMTPPPNPNNPFLRRPTSPPPPIS